MFIRCQICQIRIWNHIEQVNISNRPVDNTSFRITGLDPAGPLFEQTTSAVRIDRSDCSFVDIIHTNGGNEDAGFLGMNAAVGHSDFFPNGGHQQPKCNNNFVCSHGEAPWIWVDSGKLRL